HRSLTRRRGALYRRHLFLFTGTATPALYTLSLHDALPIWRRGPGTARRRGTGCPTPRSPATAAPAARGQRAPGRTARPATSPDGDRKSTRLNSSHRTISYAVFCLKKKKEHWAQVVTPRRPR